MYTSVCICIRVCALECLTHGGWKRSSDPLKLELQVVVSHLMGAEFQNLVLEEEQILITTELSLQSLYGIVSGLFVCVLLFCVGGWLVWGVRIKLSLVLPEHVSYFSEPATSSSP